MARLERSEARRRPSDDDLLRRAPELSDDYLGGLAAPEVGALGREPALALGVVHAR